MEARSVFMKRYLIGATIAAMLHSLTIIAQTPTPTYTLRPGEKVPKWLLDYEPPLPKAGVVPDKETAIRVAEVILFRLFGKENIIAQRPYEVKEIDGVWWVLGTAKEHKLARTFSIAISKHTAAVLHLSL